MENPEGFQFNDLRLTTNADETITAAVSLSNEEGEVLEFIANGQGSVEAIFNAIDKFFNQTVRLTSYNIDAVTDGIDAQARCLGIRGKCRYRYDFQCFWFGLRRIESLCHRLYQCQHAGSKRECG